MTTPLKFTDAEYLALVHLFAGGDISACSKAELERFAVMLSRPNAFTHFGASSFPQICETVRTLILVRMSEEQNVQAKRESRLALIIAVLALIAGVVQALAALGYLPASTKLHSNRHQVQRQSHHRNNYRPACSRHGFPPAQPGSRVDALRAPHTSTFASRRINAIRYKPRKTSRV